MEEVVNKENKLSLKYQFKDRNNRIKFITRISMFSALAFVFYAWFKLPVAILFPGFLKFSISAVFILIGAFSTGPLGGVIICLVRFALKLVISPAEEPIGECIDLLLALIYTVPASFYYLNHHDKKGGYIAIIISFISWIIGSVLVNFIFLDLYIEVYIGSVDGFINYLKSYSSSMDSSNYKLLYLLIFVLPFNALNAFINCGTTALVYKKISVLLRKIGK